MAGKEAEHYSSQQKKHRTAQTGQAVVKQKFILTSQAADDPDGTGRKQNAQRKRKKQTGKSHVFLCRFQKQDHSKNHYGK